MKKPLGAQISHMLKDRGVNVIFGIPGVHNQEMYRGIEEAGITHVLARHEQGAGFMADGYARATGKPGITYVITGPGLCNIMTPLGQAYSDSVPVLAIASCLDETAATKGQLHQMLDQEGAARTVCDWSLTARTPEAAYALVDRAISEFQSKRTRPKAIHVPIRVLEGLAEASPPPYQSSEGSPNLRPSGSPEATRRISAALAEAERPLIIFGGGVANARAHDVARRVASKSRAAVFTSYAGSGVITEDYDLFFGSFLGRPESAAVIGRADVVLAVGTELASVDLWRYELGHTSTFLRIDLDPEELDNPRADIHVVGDAAVALEQIDADLPDNKAPSHNGWDAVKAKDLRARWRIEVDAERPGIVPVCDALKATLPENTMIYSDMTQFAYVAKEVWDLPRPGHWHHPTGFGTLGYALPAGIGGAVGRKGEPTLVIAGDYGFQYTVQELGTAVELNLPLPIILWDNGKLKEIEDSMVGAQIAPNAVIAKNPDFCKLAEAYGAAAVAPASLDEMCKAVIQAFEAGGPTLIYLTPDLTLPKIVP